MRWLRTRSRDRQEYQVEKLAVDEVSEEIEEAWSLVFEELDRIAGHAGESGIPLLVVIAPYRFQLDAPATTGQPQDRVKQWRRRRGVPVFDLLPVFAEFRARTGLQLFNDANHYSPPGHELAARELASIVGWFVANLDSGDATPG